MMEAKKEDRRIKYTKRALRETLFELLQKKTIDKISVKELCEAADVSRSTFYSYYADQYQLLKETEEDLLMNVSQYLDEQSFRLYNDSGVQVMARIFAFISENAEPFRVLLGEYGDATLQEDILGLLRERGVVAWQGLGNINSQTMEYIQLYAFSGTLGVLKCWISKGMRESAHEMAELIARVIYNGFSAFAAGEPKQT